MSSYNDFLEVMQSGELAPFKTIVIDTAGKMLDYMGAWLIQNDRSWANGTAACP